MLNRAGTRPDDTNRFQPIAFNYGNEALCKIITNAYETGEVPEDFEKCVMIPIPKKQKAEK